MERKIISFYSEQRIRGTYAHKLSFDKTFW